MFKIINVRPYEGIYFHILFDSLNCTAKCYLTKFFSNTDDIRLHIGSPTYIYSFAAEGKKTDDNVLLVYVLIILPFFFPL